MCACVRIVSNVLNVLNTEIKILYIRLMINYLPMLTSLQYMRMHTQNHIKNTSYNLDHLTTPKSFDTFTNSFFFVNKIFNSKNPTSLLEICLYSLCFLFDLIFGSIKLMKR